MDGALRIAPMRNKCVEECTSVIDLVLMCACMASVFESVCAQEGVGLCSQMIVVFLYVCVHLVLNSWV